MRKRPQSTNEFPLHFRNQTPADAEYNFLDHAMRLEYYGVDLYEASVSFFLC